MIATLRRGGAEVLTFTMPDMAQVNPLTRLIRFRLEGLNERLRQTCVTPGCSTSRRAPTWRVTRGCGTPTDCTRTRWATSASGWAWPRRWGWPSTPRGARPCRRARPPSVRERLQHELGWTRDYLLPWVVRHAKGSSSGDGREAKRPTLARVERTLPAGQGDAVDRAACASSRWRWRCW
jgi:hypothetical protein